VMIRVATRSGWAGFLVRREKILGSALAVGESVVHMAFF